MQALAAGLLRAGASRPRLGHPRSIQPIAIVAHMTDSNPPDDMLTHAIEVLSEGPLHLDALVERLDQAGLLDGLRADGVDEEDLAEAVDEELLYTDAVWSSPTDVLALSSHLTEGLVLTHRLTADEISGGHVVLTPDLVALDWDEPDGLELGGGNRLVHQLGARIPGEDNATLAGPDRLAQWLRRRRGRGLRSQRTVGLRRACWGSR